MNVENRRAKAGAVGDELLVEELVEVFVPEFLKDEADEICDQD